MGDHLGVGLGDERVAASLQVRPQLAVVFDDAVVNDGYPPAAVPVRMGVAVGRRPVRRPARVRDARRPDEVGRLATLDERGDTARALDAVQGAVGPQHRDARGVISPVLECLETLEQVADCLATAGIANDSAHAEPPRVCVWGTSRF